jgi:hypothetical protein
MKARWTHSVWRVFVVGSVLGGAIGAGLVLYQLAGLDRSSALLRQVGVGMSEDDVRGILGAEPRVLSSPVELAHDPYRDYEQSTRAFPHHLVVYSVGDELLQLHCDADGRIECVFWGRRK